MATTTPPVAFVTLGMFIIDEIEQKDHSGPDSWLIGGAGTYAALGARLVAGRDESSSVGWIVDVGSDFPATFKTELESWNTSCVFRTNNGRLTTRAWNGYNDDEARAFKYLTPKLRLDQESLPHSHLFASVFHFVCSASRALDLVQGIVKRRQEIEAESAPPIFVWEPVPDLCVPSEMGRFLEACKFVDIVSPNQLELAGFFESEPTLDQDRMAEKVLKNGIGRSKQCENGGILVVRAGSHGCYAYQGLKKLHLPAYHLPVDPEGGTSKKVVDPTGGGNAFLGALSMALVRQREVDNHANMGQFERETWTKMAMQWNKEEKIAMSLIFASVAAAFAIEQAGMPSLSSGNSYQDTWNDESVETRVSLYVAREKGYILDQTWIQ